MYKLLIFIKTATYKKMYSVLQISWQVIKIIKQVVTFTLIQLNTHHATSQN